MTGSARWIRSKAWLVFLLLAVALGTGLVAARVAPWYDAAPVPVQLWLDAPADTPITLVWDADASNGVPLVPCVKAGEARARLWLGELPPRPHYQLAITFAGPVRQVVLNELILVDVRHLDEPLLHIRGDDLCRRFADAGMQFTCTERGALLDGPSQASLTIPGTVPERSRRTWYRFGKVWMICSAACLLAGLLLAACFRQAGTILLAESGHPDRIGHPRLVPLCVSFVLGLAFHLSVTASLPAVYNPFDPLAYFHKAVFLAELGTYTTNTPSWEMDRLPGYPLFLALCLKLFGYHLKAVTMSQGVLFGTALLALGVSLRRWVSGWCTAGAVLLLLVSPVGLMQTLSIGTEGLFASLAAFSLAAFFEHVGTERRASVLWLAAFGVLTAASVFVRPNGIVLLAAPLTVYVPSAIKALHNSAGARAKLTAFAGCTLRYSLPGVMLIASLGAWAVRNQRAHGLLAPTSMVGVSLVEGRMQSGIFDSRSLEPESLYGEYLRHKYRTGYACGGWNVRHLIRQHLMGEESCEPPDIIAVMDGRMRRIAARSDALSPWELKMGGLLRSLSWAFQLPHRRSFTRNEICGAPRYIGNHPGATGAWKDFCCQRAPKDLGKPLSLADLDDQELTTQWPLPFVRPEGYAMIHRWLYAVFLVAGLAWGALTMRYNAVALAAPTLVYLANIGVNTWLLNVQGRYLLTLESLLVFQTFMGIHFLARYLRGAALAGTSRTPAGAAATRDVVPWDVAA